MNVQGNLNKRTFGKDIFLWYRPIKSRQVGWRASALYFVKIVFGAAFYAQ